MRKDHIDIVYEDKDIIVVNKRPNLLTISTDKEKIKTLFHNTLLYLKGKNKNNKVFIVHRLDFDTSGLVLFAKSELNKKILQDNWNDTIRRYYAVCDGKFKKNSGTFKSWLKETKTLLTYSSNIKDNGKLAITQYKVLKSNNKYSLVDINILTGRKNQIRVHMKELGCPITGDKKYGNGMGNRLMLHAYYLEFTHPRTKKKVILDLGIPADFEKKVGN